MKVKNIVDQWEEIKENTVNHRGGLLLQNFTLVGYYETELSVEMMKAEMESGVNKEVVGNILSKLVGRCAEISKTTNVDPVKFNNDDTMKASMEIMYIGKRMADSDFFETPIDKEALKRFISSSLYMAQICMDMVGVDVYVNKTRDIDLN